MANWNDPVLSTAYSAFLTALKDRDGDAATMFDVGTPTNVPTDAIKFSKSGGLFQKWTGAVWSAVQLKTAAIENLAITTALLADGSVTAAKLAPGAGVGLLGYTPVNKAGDVMTGGLGISMASPNIEFTETDAANKKWGINGNGGALAIYEDTTATPRLSIAAGASALAISAALTFGGQTVWHAGNDGAFSGLDADTCDGQHLGTGAAVQFAGLGLGAAYDGQSILNVSGAGMLSNLNRRAVSVTADNTTQTLTAARYHTGGFFQFANKHYDASGFLVNVFGVEGLALNGATGVKGRANELVGGQFVAFQNTDQATDNLVTTAVGVRGRVVSSHVNALATVAYGVQSEVNSAGGIATGYLFYGAFTGTAPTAAAWGMRLIGDVKSQLDGALGLGIVPVEKLHVSGNGLFTGAVSGLQHLGSGAQAAAAPDFAFTADPNCGMRSYGADKVALTTGGADRLMVDEVGRVGIGVAPSLYIAGVAITTLFQGTGSAYAGTAFGNTVTANSIATVMSYVSTDATAADGPALVFDRQSTTPAALDVLASLVFRGRNAGAVAKNYASVQADIIDPTASAEAGGLSFRTLLAGTDAVRAYLRNGFVIGSPTGGDKGAGTLNATALYWNGTSLAGKAHLLLASSAFYARTTAGATAYSAEAATNKNMAKGWSFDPATAQYIQARFPMPKGWNKGTLDLTLRGVRPTGTGTSGMRFAAQARIVDSGDLEDGAFGTAVGVTVTPVTTANTDFTVAITGITPAGTTSEATSTLILQVYRDVTNAGDTDATNAGVILDALLAYTASAPTDD